MARMNIFSRKNNDVDEFQGDEYMEVNVMDSSEKRPGKIGIRIESLEDFADTDRVLRQVREGTVVFLKIKALREKDMGDLKRAVEKLKKSIAANSGDIAGVEQNWLILTPHYATVHR